MTRRILGRSKIEVSPLGMGCWAIGGPFWAGDTPLGWGEVDDDESIRAIHTALDHGITFFDTANVYGAGHSERILGKALSGRRSDVVIATKFHNVFNESTRKIIGCCTTPDGIRSALEDSLRRLDTDYIDLYQFHDNAYPTDKAQPVRETLEDIAAEGKIRWYGWSTDFPDRAAVFAKGSHCTTIQAELNVFEPKNGIIELCMKNELGVICRGPLAMGLLTNKYSAATQVTDDQVRGEKSPDWMRYFSGGRPNPEFIKKVDAVREILMSKGRTLAQGALAWIWAHSPLTVPIPGFRTAEQVEENVRAIEHGPLTENQMKEIEAILNRN
jgi:aryl-alcohol dehydrogenase-like predicted oxidoreductase